MSSRQPAFYRLKNKSKSKGKNKIRRTKTVRRRRKISPRKRPGSPLSNEIKIEELEVDTSPKGRKTPTPVKQKSIKDLAIEIANSKESQPSSCFGKFCKKLTRRGGKRRVKRTRKRRRKRRKGR